MDSLGHGVGHGIRAGALAGLIWGLFILGWVSPLLENAHNFQNGQAAPVREISRALPPSEALATPSPWPGSGGDARQSESSPPGEAGTASPEARSRPPGVGEVEPLTLAPLLFTLIRAVLLGVGLGILAALVITLGRRLDPARGQRWLDFPGFYGPVFGLAGFLVFNGIPALGQVMPPAAIPGDGAVFGQAGGLLSILLFADGGSGTFYRLAPCRAAGSDLDADSACGRVGAGPDSVLGPGMDGGLRRPPGLAPATDQCGILGGDGDGAPSFNARIRPSGARLRGRWFQRKASATAAVMAWIERTDAFSIR